MPREPGPRGLAAILGATGAPAVITTAHLAYGAALPLPALVLSGCLLLILALALSTKDARAELDRLPRRWVLLSLFTAVIGMAAYSLTPGPTGAAHPIWAWSGGEPSISLNRSATRLEILKLLGLASAFLIGWLQGLRPDTARRTFSSVLALGGLHALVSLGFYLSPGAPGEPPIRLNGGFDSPNVAAALFGMLLVVSLAWGLYRWGRTSGRPTTERVTAIVPSAALGLLFLTCVVLAASRAALGATIVGALFLCAVIAASDRQSRRPAMLAFAGVATALLATFVFAGETLLDRFERLEGDNITRADLVAAHWRAFLEAPLLGVGLGAYPDATGLIMTTDNARALSSTVVLHNAYLQWLTEAGVLGSMPMLLLLAVILTVTAWGGLRSGSRILVAGLLAGTVVSLVHAAVDVTLNTPSVCALWSLVLGLGYGLSQGPRRGRRTPRSR